MFGSVLFAIKNLIFLSLKIVANDKWVLVRSCNKRDNLTDAKNAEAYLCHSDFCNSAVKLNSKTSILLIVGFVGRLLLQ